MTTEEETLVLIKPDALDRRMAGEILQRFERAGLRLNRIRRVTFTRELLTKHYAELRSKLPRAYDRTARYLEGKDVIALTLLGVNGIQKVRALVGPTDPLSAPAGTLRGDLSSDSVQLADCEDRGCKNLVHASDSPETARFEIQLWFG